MLNISKTSPVEPTEGTHVHSKRNTRAHVSPHSSPRQVHSRWWSFPVRLQSMNKTFIPVHFQVVNTTNHFHTECNSSQHTLSCFPECISRSRKHKVSMPSVFPPALWTRQEADFLGFSHTHTPADTTKQEAPSAHVTQWRVVGSRSKISNCFPQTFALD